MFITNLCPIYKFLSYQDGRNYSGNFDYDAIKGNGTMWFPNGTVYKGNFHYGIMMGNAGNKNLQMGSLIITFFFISSTMFD